MAAFITRVELHRANEDDYRLLHTEMRGRGFSKSVTSSDGGAYLLPPGDYNYEADVEITAIKEAATSAVNVTGRQGTVFVAEYVRWSGNNMSPA
jgi:hypothetical protein